MLQNSWQVIVNGGSMRPFLRHGQRLVCENTDPQILRPGDIAVFRGSAQQKPIVHRVRRLDRSGGRLRFLARGDNLGKSDGWIDFSMIMGTAVATINPGGVKKITSLERRGALLLAPLLFGIRRLAIRFLAFCMRFVYPFMSGVSVRHVDAGGVVRIERRWLGWPVCRSKSNGRVWVHPVFVRTSVLKDILREQ